MRWWIGLWLVTMHPACADKSDTGAAQTPVDADGDGWSLEEDCNDDDAQVHPGATEVCGGGDEDCDGLSDDDDPSTDPASQTAWHPDADTDGFGDMNADSILACEAPDDAVTDASDCNDGDPAIHPSASEVCNGLDDDCDGLTDDDDDDLDPTTRTVWYVDQDADGFGDPAAETVQACAAPESRVADHTDCDDSDPEVNPAATEVCDGDDEDCDGLVDGDDPSLDPESQSSWYPDADGDGFGDADGVIRSCTQPAGTLADGDDCDDTNAEVAPGLPEICDGNDNDCDPSTTEAGLATLRTLAGAAEDLTPALTGGAGDPVSYTLSEGGTLRMCAGTWFVALDLRSDVEIQGTSMGETLLSGEGLATPVTIDTDGLDVRISDLTLTNGLAVGDVLDLGVGNEGGGNLHCEGSNVVDLTRVAITRGEAYAGGGLLVEDCDVAMTDAVIAFNHATALGGAGLVNGGTLTLASTLVEANTSDTYGGGFEVGTYALVHPAVSRDASLELHDVLMRDNIGAEGGALVVELDGSVLCAGGSSIVANDGGNAAGAVQFYGEGLFESMGCDLGSAAEVNDNLPVDISGVGDDNFDGPTWQRCTEQGCTTTILTVEDLLPGDLLITEVMTTPSAVADADGEWFEIQSSLDHPVSLDGLQIYDDGGELDTLGGGFVLEPGARAVLAAEADAALNGGVDVDLQYAGIHLDGIDTLVLASPSTEIDRIGWDGGVTWPGTPGAAMALGASSYDATANDDGLNWCQATTSYGLGDLGSPGVTNPDC